MTYLDFEKEYIKDRPTEPYLENEENPTLKYINIVGEKLE